MINKNFLKLNLSLLATIALVGVIYFDSDKAQGADIIFNQADQDGGQAALIINKTDIDHESGKVPEAKEEADFQLQQQVQIRVIDAIIEPTVLTRPISDVTSTTAIGSGDIIATGGEDPERIMEWGISSGNYTNLCSAGVGGSGSYSCNIINLEGGTTYYMRAKAVNSAGTSYGAEIIFQTLSNITEECESEKLEADAISSSEIKLSWTDNCGSESGYEIERKNTDGEFKKIDSIGKNKESYIDKNLRSNTVYEYRIRSYDIDGVSGYSNKVSAKTLEEAEAELGENILLDLPDENIQLETENEVLSFDADNDLKNDNVSEEENFSADEVPQSSKIAKLISEGKQISEEILEDPTVKKSSIIAESAGLAAGAVSVAVATGAIPLVPLSPTPFADIFSKLLRLFGFFARSKKRDEWGTVFDVETHSPISGAEISIFNIDEKMIDSVTTNSEGKFGFLASRGEYSFKVFKKDYELFKDDKTDEFYGDLYDGNTFIIEDGEVAKMSIALKANNIDWQNFSKRKIAAYNSTLSIIKKNIFAIMFYVGFIVSVGLSYISFSFFNGIMVVLYLAMIAYNFFFKTRNYGLITTKTKESIPFAVISLYGENAPQKRLTFSVSDVIGRYFVLVENGNYLMKVQGRELGGNPFSKLFPISVEKGVFKDDIIINENDYLKKD
ncbi:MAG TPA: hypothetical protein DIC35_05065 [Candidatus Moranbacteria bacterium]|nr:hypothetical protein [Candidatus Moranbacteria bacterium]